MKLVTHLYDDHEQLAIFHNGLLYNMDKLHPEMPNTMSMLLAYWEDMMETALKLNQAIVDGRVSEAKGIAIEDAYLLAPVALPASLRISTLQNAYHYGNHNALQGEGDILVMPDHLDDLEHEAGIAIVIGRGGKNIPAGEAGAHIGGVMLMSRFISGNNKSTAEASASFGPWLVTPGELKSGDEEHEENSETTSWEIPIGVQVNGEETDVRKFSYDFGPLIECCSYGVTLHPGDVVGVTLPRRRKLTAGDAVAVQSEWLGVLKNTIEADESDWRLPKG